MHAEEDRKSWLKRMNESPHTQFHRIWCYDGKGNSRTEILRCNNPIWSGGRYKTKPKVAVYFNYCGIKDIDGTWDNAQYGLINFAGKCVPAATGYKKIKPFLFNHDVEDNLGFGGGSTIGGDIDLRDYGAIRWDNKTNLPYLDETEMHKISGGYFGRYSRWWDLQFVDNAYLKVGIFAALIFLIAHLAYVGSHVQAGGKNNGGMSASEAFFGALIIIIIMGVSAPFLQWRGEVIQQSEKAYIKHFNSVHKRFKYASMYDSKFFRPITDVHTIHRYETPTIVWGQKKEKFDGQFNNRFWRGLFFLGFFIYNCILVWLFWMLMPTIYVGALDRFTSSRHKSGYAGPRSVPKTIRDGSVSLFDSIFISPFRRIYSKVHTVKAYNVADELHQRMKESESDAEVADLEREVLLRETELDEHVRAVEKARRELDEKRRQKTN